MLIFNSIELQNLINKNKKTKLANLTKKDILVQLDKYL